MKSFSFKIISVFMALLVLISTFSFMVDQHFCMGSLVDFSFFGKAETCGMIIEQPSDSHEHNIIGSACCDDDTISIIGQNDLKVSHENISTGQIQFVISFVYSYLNLLEGLEESTVPFTQYPPPLLVKDILILDQTFLI